MSSSRLVKAKPTTKTRPLLEVSRAGNSTSPSPPPAARTKQCLSVPVTAGWPQSHAQKSYSSLVRLSHAALASTSALINKSIGSTSADYNSNTGAHAAAAAAVAAAAASSTLKAAEVRVQGCQLHHQRKNPQLVLELPQNPYAHKNADSVLKITHVQGHSQIQDHVHARSRMLKDRHGGGQSPGAGHTEIDFRAIDEAEAARVKERRAVGRDDDQHDMFLRALRLNGVLPTMSDLEAVVHEG